MLDDDVLVAIAAVWAALIVVRTIRASGPVRQTEWVVASAVVLAVCGVLSWLQLDGRGWLALGVAALLLIVPVRLAHLYFRFVLGQRYGAAGAVTVLLLLLHPTRGLLADRRVLAALRRAASGDAEAALAMLRSIAADPCLPEPRRLSALAWAGRIRRDWTGVAALPDSPVTRAMRLRGLGELGQTEALVASYRPDASPLEAMMMLAFCGRPDAVGRLIAGPLDALRPDTRAFWLATAHYTAGEPRLAEALLRGTTPRDAEMKASLADRLQGSLTSQPLTPTTWAVVDDVAARVLTTPPTQNRHPWATYALILVNVAVFAVEEAAGGSTDNDTLFSLGALWPPAVVGGGEVWRVGAALFLHNGTAHILFNMAALAVFGARLEPDLGQLRFLLVYLGAGLASMASIVGLTELGLLAPSLLVGASGAIMGLVGASAGLALRTMRANPVASRRSLRAAASIVVLQAMFDLLIPQVSFTGHATGAVAGFALALIVPRRRLR